MENPSDEDLAGFRAYMNPPDVEPPTLKITSAPAMSMR
jgi:hypothetical protein